MEPHIVKQVSSCHTKTPTMAIENVLKLEDYEVSSTHGFLPSEPPSTELPKYYAPWETISSNLYILRVEKKLASTIAQLPILTTHHLTNKSEWRRAYLLLGFIANAYIWGSGKPKEVRAGIPKDAHNVDDC